jgi:phosphotransferase system HPr (HPr) family protein
MVSRTVKILNGLGIHCRPSCLVAKAASECTCKVTVQTEDGASADATRVLELLGLALGPGDMATVLCEGENEEEALERMSALLVRNFDFKR